VSTARRLLLLVMPLLWCAVLASSAGTIYSKYRAWSAYGFVERVAGERLHMNIPDSRDIEIIAP